MFDELYLTDGLDWRSNPHSGGKKSPFIDGGAQMVSLNGYSYLRMDNPHVHEQREPYADEDYDPEHQRARAAAIREEKFKQISKLLSGLAIKNILHK